MNKERKIPIYLMNDQPHVSSKKLTKVENYRSKDRSADPPQDCDWPTCGCDPNANDVIEALQEAGHLPSTQPPLSEHPDPSKRCQHDLLKPTTTIEVIDAWKARCLVCLEFFDLPGRPTATKGGDADVPG